MDYNELVLDLEGHAAILDCGDESHQAAAENLRRGAKAIRVIPDLLAASQFLVKYAKMRADRGDQLPRQLIDAATKSIAQAVECAA